MSFSFNTEHGQPWWSCINKKYIYKQVIRGDEQELKTESKDAFLIFFQFKS